MLLALLLEGSSAFLLLNGLSSPQAGVWGIIIFLLTVAGLWFTTFIFSGFLYLLFKPPHLLWVEVMVGNVGCSASSAQLVRLAETSAPTWGP